MNVEEQGKKIRTEIYLESDSKMRVKLYLNQSVTKMRIQVTTPTITGEGKTISLRTREELIFERLST